MSDIEEEWGLLKSVTRSPAASPESVEDDWRDIKGLPEFIYTAHKGYSIRDMALWRLRPESHRKAVLHGRLQEFWTFRHEKLLWAGGSYVPHETTRSGRVFRTGAKQISLTLDDAFKRLDGYRREHIQNLESAIAQYERDIREKHAHISTFRASIEEGHALHFNDALLNT